MAILSNMSPAKELPRLEELQDYNHAVAGHAGTLCDAEGELFIKPCTKREVDFYEAVNAHHPDLAECMPGYFGIISMIPDATNGNIEEAVAGVISENGQLQSSADQIIASVREQISNAPETPQPEDNDTWVPSLGKKIETDLNLVLENQTHGFKHANVLDVKLGTRLYADYAPTQKKARFDQISKETTHHNLGFRIAGMRVFRGSEDPSELDDEEYKVYDKDYGRVMVNDDNVGDELRRFLLNTAAGIDEELSNAVCAVFLRELEKIIAALRVSEIRTFSTSLLFVYEGDGEALRQAIESHNSLVDAANRRASCPPVTKRIDSGIGLDEEDLDDDRIEEFEESLRKIVNVNLIDFAHAELTPGQGPDENTLKGAESVYGFFQEMLD